MRLTIASRKSDLARIQAHQVAQAICAQHPRVEIDFHFRASLGDQNQHDPLWQMPEKGAFTEDFYTDLVDGKFDLVVHSWKDLPLPDERVATKTEIVATLPRADQRDLFLFRRNRLTHVQESKHLSVLTSSPRREYNLQALLAQLLPFHLNKIEFQVVRGNVPTRLEKLMNHDVDGLVVAKAALDRLLECENKEFYPVQKRIREILNSVYWMVLPLTENPTAAGQGALAIEIRKDNAKLRKLIESINSQTDFALVREERQILREFGGGCHQKIGISKLKCDFGAITVVRGTQNDLQFHEVRPDVTPRLSKVRDFWPKPDCKVDLFDRENIAPPYTPALRECGFWVAKSCALPEDWPIAHEQLVWCAGLQTWKKLARRGIWVNGSAEGLGEADIPGGLAEPRVSTLCGEPPRWLKLTHETAPSSGGMPVLATYKLVAHSSQKLDFSGITHFYWSSGSQFDRALELAPEIMGGYHACGPGLTYAHLLRRGVSEDHLDIYLSYDEWKKDVTDALNRT